MIKTLRLRTFFILLIVTIIMFITAVRLNKMILEMERIDIKIEREYNCVQYSLSVNIDGYYSCYKDGTIYLTKGDIWKYGKTCNENTRYLKNYLIKNHFSFNVEYIGSEKECLIMEKYKIYLYPFKRQTKLMRPPGNKIDR